MSTLEDIEDDDGQFPAGPLLNNNSPASSLRHRFDKVVAAADEKKAQAEAAKPISLSDIWALVADDFREDKSFKILHDRAGKFYGISISTEHNGVDRLTISDNGDGTFRMGNSNKTSPEETMDTIAQFYADHKSAKPARPVFRGDPTL